MGKKKGILLIVITALVLSLLPVSVFAGEQSAANAPISTSVVQEAKTGNEVQAEHRNYLFIGNSLTHYNNRPVMFRELVKAGTGKEVSCTALTYSNRTQIEHANAIAAVFRTKGDITKLTEAEKQYFYVPDRNYYAEEVYRGYADRLWDYKAQKPIRYDTVILQSFYREGLGDIGSEFAEAVANIIRTMNSPSTTYVLEATMGMFDARLDGFLQKQDVIDQSVKEAVENAKHAAAGCYADIRISWYGRALCNYFCTYGETYAQAVEPAAYIPYSAKKGIVNDLIYGDKIHPTQLGTYIAAATLYSALYGDPLKAAAGYPGGICDNDIDVRVDGVKIYGIYNIANKYNGGNGLKCQKLTEAAAYIAKRTQINGAVLKVGSEQNVKAEKPVLETITNVNGGVRLTWKDSKKAVLYRVFRKVTGVTDWEPLGVTAYTLFTDKTVKPGVSYTYTVRCINSTQTAFTSGFDKKGKTIRYIKAPVLTSASNTKDGVTVKWRASKGAEKYRVYRKEASAKTWTKLLGVTAKTSFTDKTAVSGTEYIYAVRCVNGANTEFTSAYDPNGIAVHYIAAPKLKSLTKNAKGVTLTWKASKGAGQYRVIRKVKGTDKWTKVADTWNTSWTDTTAKPGVTYCYSVRCLNAAKNGWLSAYDAKGLTIKR